MVNEVEVFIFLYQLSYDSGKLSFVKQFETKEHAEKWIKDEGERKIYYTIIESFRKQ